MVYHLLRHFDSWCARLCASDIRVAHELRWASNSSMGMVHWQHHGILYSQLRYAIHIPYHAHIMLT